MTMPADLADPDARDRARGALVATLQGPDFLRRFRDIRVEPAATPRGWPAGPSRAALSDRDLAWHWVNGHPNPQPLAASDRPPLVLEGETVWCGAVMSHFGHTIAEQFQRVLFSRLAMPGATYLFSLPKGRSEAQVPGYLWGACDWFGLPRAQVRFVTDRPLLARDLSVFRQGEQFQPLTPPALVEIHEWCGPLPEYLDALDLHQQGRVPDVDPSGVLYVSRSRLDPYQIPFPGEACLVDRLRAAGVRVIWPETMSIRDQIEAYASAGTLIFAEGSALHLRQFLGRLPQRIVILNRRKRLPIGREVLEPRCRELVYLDAVAGNAVFTISPQGVAERARAFPIIDQARLLDGFRSLGIDLSEGWDAARYRAEHDAALAAWVQAVCRAARPEDRRDRMRLLEGSLLGAGLGEYLPRLKRIAMAAEKARQTEGPAA